MCVATNVKNDLYSLSPVWITELAVQKIEGLLYLHKHALIRPLHVLFILVICLGDDDTPTTTKNIPLQRKVSPIIPAKPLKVVNMFQ